MNREPSQSISFPAICSYGNVQASGWSWPDVNLGNYGPKPICSV